MIYVVKYILYIPNITDITAIESHKKVKIKIKQSNHTTVVVTCHSGQSILQCYEQHSFITGFLKTFFIFYYQ